MKSPFLMKLTKLILTLGWLCIFTGLTLFLFQENKIEESKIEQEINTNQKYKPCLMEVIWFEGRGLSYLEKEAILDIVINRSRSNKYPDDLCEVVQQNKQFSYRNHLKDKSQIILPAFQSISGKPDRDAYLEIEEIVNNRLSSSLISNKVLPKGAMWYHADAINKPYWARSKNVEEVKIPVDNRFRHRYYASAVR